MWSCSPFWGVHVAVLCDDWGGGQMFEGNSLLLKMSCSSCIIWGGVISVMPWIFSRIWWVTIGWEHATKECHRVLFDGAFAAVKNESFFSGYIEQIYDFSIMVSGHPSHIWIHHHVWPILLDIGLQCHPFCIWKMSLTHFESKWYM